jgi:hypothetical protein
MISLVAGPLPTQRNTNREETRTSMPRVGIESTIPVFRRAKTFRALDRTATAIGLK